MTDTNTTDTATPLSFTTEDARWVAVCTKDSAAEGNFWFAVTTTGVYCRPTCRSRQPLRQNVRFFDSPATAEAAGFRPCKRCQPHQPEPYIEGEHVQAIEQACALIRNSESAPTLATLAATVGMSPYHFQRIFKARLGVTPKQYAMTLRRQRAAEMLPEADSVTAAIFDAGYNNGGHFYSESNDTIGMTPTTYRRGAAGETIRLGVAECYLGWVLVAATPRGLCAIDLGDDPHALEAGLRSRFPKAEIARDASLAAWMQQVVRFLDAPESGLRLPLDIQGTAFQQRVWAALREIPAGSTLSYTEVAERIGAPSAVRAVAAACAANKLAVAIPCHRVVRQNGELSGYRWGIERKRRLLARERQK
ncbi:bifunctional DNA-binding transcriptional regulator/O6-methylguanine-DNA methyltransferase Ada [Caldilinea sp.]|uniref:bifunctional DNA-binding transcriptional regulator/O6-methylguanine-DNA methyltransferase Ada n=1 Tax=Caldilinea sp. TaxID=2293560 RepID=UPI002D0B59FF|nr:bifunctional DNA-binding transcriptional regulator/O6-methylguanine-DNA methyltransferase Ada [Caldilinea sp.]